MIEKRKYPRVDVDFQLTCRRAGQTGSTSCLGQAVNASPGGLFFRTEKCACDNGTVVEVEFAIPPGNGRLHRPGRISGFAKLIRTEHLHPASIALENTENNFGVAVQFCRSPKLTTL